MEQPPSFLTAKRGMRVTFAAPEGFAKYTWVLEGKAVGYDRTIGLAFASNGTHYVSCRCEQPTQGSPSEFHVARYEVTVE